MVIFKKSIVFMLIILLLLSCSIYLDNKYNKSAVFYDLESPVDYRFMNDRSMREVSLYGFSYSKPYMDFELIMTTGRAEAFVRDNFISGVNISKVDTSGIVLGDEVAGFYFNRSDVLGESLELFNKKYTVIGIKEGSDEIIIPFEKSLVNDNWTKMNMYVTFNNEEDIIAKAQSVEFKIKEAGASVISYVIVNESIYFFKNIILVVFLIFMFNILIKTSVGLSDYTKHIYEEISRKIHRESILLLIKKQTKEIVLSFVLLIGLMLGLYLTFRVIMNFKIPQILMPNNFLSLRSWIDIFENIISRLLTGFKFGFMDVSRDFIILLMISSVGTSSLNRFYHAVIKKIQIEKLFIKKSKKEVEHGV